MKKLHVSLFGLFALILVTSCGQLSPPIDDNPTTFTLSISNSPESGAVTIAPDKTTFTDGETVTLTAVASADYLFTGWSGDLTDTTNPVTITMDSNKSIAANYELITIQYDLTITSSPTIGGSVTTNPTGINFNEDTIVELTAVPATGYQFTGWSEGISGTTNPQSITMDTDKSVTANFELIPAQYSLTSLSNPIIGGTVTRTPNEPTYLEDSIVQLTAVPAPGYCFAGWSGDISDSSSSVSITMDSDKNVTAEFVEVEIRLQYYCGVIGNSNVMYPNINLINDGEGIIDLEKVVIKYFVTHDPSVLYYQLLDSASFENLDSITVSIDENSFTFGFDSTAGYLASGSQTDRLGYLFFQTDYLTIIKTDDYSYDPNFTSLADYSKIAVYYDGCLVYGTEAP